MAKNVYQELMDALPGLKPKGAKEGEQDYLARIAREADEKLDDEQWEALSKDAQAWLNKASTALEQETSLPNPTGLPTAKATKKKAAKKTTKKKTSSKGTEAESEESDAKATKKKKTTKKKKAAKKTTMKKAAKPKGARRAPGEKATSGSGRVEQLCCEHPNATADEIRKLLKKEKMEVSEQNLKLGYSHIKRIFRQLAYYGHLKQGVFKES